MTRIISWIVMLVVGVAVVVFAVVNRSPFAIDLWPLPYQTEVPAFAPIFGAAFVGFVAGGIIAWFSAGVTRRRARFASRRAETLERDLGKLKHQIRELEHRQKLPPADKS